LHWLLVVFDLRLRRRGRSGSEVLVKPAEREALVTPERPVNVMDAQGP